MPRDIGGEYADQDAVQEPEDQTFAHVHLTVFENRHYHNRPLVEFLNKLRRTAVLHRISPWQHKVAGWNR